jgi:hypothetical protein
MTQFDVVERAADIPAPPSAILPMLVDFRRWQEWSPWEGLDPQLKRAYSGQEHAVGSRYLWSGNRKAGAGSMTITSVSDTAVRIDLAFTRPFRSTSEIVFVLAPAGAGTHLVWRMRTARTKASAVTRLFFNAEKMIGPDLERGLAGLERIASS